MVLFSILYKKEVVLYLSLGLLSVTKIELFILLAIAIGIYKLIKKEKICSGYGIDFCSYIMDNCGKMMTIDKDVVIYKAK